VRADTWAVQEISTRHVSLAAADAEDVGGWLNRVLAALESQGAAVHLAPNGHFTAVVELDGALVGLEIVVGEPVRLVVRADLLPARLAQCADRVVGLLELAPAA
jgi:hypothetical protein